MLVWLWHNFSALMAWYHSFLNLATFSSFIGTANGGVTYLFLPMSLPELSFHLLSKYNCAILCISLFILLPLARVSCSLFFCVKWEIAHFCHWDSNCLCISFWQPAGISFCLIRIVFLLLHWNLNCIRNTHTKKKKGQKIPQNFPSNHKGEFQYCMASLTISDSYS